MDLNLCTYNKRTAGTLTFVKTMAVFSSVCHVLLCTAMYAFVYQMPHISLAPRGQCKKSCNMAYLLGYYPTMTEDCVRVKSKEDGKDQETIQLSTTHDPGYHMG